MIAGLSSFARRLVPPLGLLVLVGVIWQFLVWWMEVPPIFLPGPIRIWRETTEQFPRLIQATGRTAVAAGLGFLTSMGLGTAIAMVFSQSPWIRRSCFPYAIFLQTVPIVAIAPVIVVWVGEGIIAVVIVATIISLFPIITNVTEGLTSIPKDHQDLFTLYGATRWQTLWRLQLPHALPDLVTGAKIAAGNSVLGAIVGEMFAGIAGTNPGLGYVIFAATDRYNMAFVFSAIATTTCLGVAMFWFVHWVGERWLLPWRERRIHEESATNGNQAPR